MALYINQPSDAAEDDLHSAMSGVWDGLELKRVKEALAFELTRPLISRSQCPVDSAGKDDKE